MEHHSGKDKEVEGKEEEEKHTPVHNPHGGPKFCRESFSVVRRRRSVEAKGQTDKVKSWSW